MRLVWRYNFAYLPPFPESMPKLQQWVAKANEYGLYALLLVQPLSGLGNVLFRGRSFSLFIWEMPALFAANPIIRSVFVEAHELGGMALLTLIGLHTGAALFHRLVLRDGVLQRMVPWTSANAPTWKNKSKLIAQHVKKITPQPAR
jgi:cytochrome b561